MEIIITASTMFPTEQKEIVKQTIYNLISQQLSKNLKISKLDKIIIPEDFGEAVLEIQREYDLIEKGYTSNEFGKAFAKVMPIIKNGVKKRIIVLDKHLVTSLYIDEYKQLAIHLIHHELCHVHDEYFKEKLKFDLYNYFNLENILYAYADTIWSEYIASKLSVTTLPQKSDLYVPHLLEIIEEIRKRIEKYIKEYRYSADINILFTKIQDDSLYLLKFACTTCGYMQGLNSEKLNTTIFDIISTTSFKEIWIELTKELKKLFNIYPNWSGISQLKKLSLIILKYWNDNGIFPEMQDDMLYIDVPFEH